MKNLSLRYLVFIKKPKLGTNFREILHRHSTSFCFFIYLLNAATILVIIFWHFLIIWLRSESPQVKRYLISTITNLVQELPQNLRLRISGNQEILEKCRMWVETQPSARSSFQELNVDNRFLSLCQIFRLGLSEEIKF